MVWRGMVDPLMAVKPAGEYVAWRTCEWIRRRSLTDLFNSTQVMNVTSVHGRDPSMDVIRHTSLSLACQLVTVKCAVGRRDGVGPTPYDWGRTARLMCH